MSTLLTPFSPARMNTRRGFQMHHIKSNSLSLGQDAFVCKPLPFAVQNNTLLAPSNPCCTATLSAPRNLFREVSIFFLTHESLPG